MLHLRFFVFCACLFTLSSLTAQEEAVTNGKVEYVQDVRINELTDYYKKVNEKDQSVDGYRVQIFFDSGSNSKKRASDAMDEFISKYPNSRVFLSFKSPYYRVRVGNFRTLAEAVGYQKKILADYPNAFPVKEKISFKELE